jgi:hypothetical protein
MKFSARGHLQAAHPARPPGLGVRAEHAEAQRHATVAGKELERIGVSSFNMEKNELL